MKKLIIVVICLLTSVISYSNHLKGGWIYYEALGPGTAPNTVKYRITIKQYLDCNSTPAQIDQDVNLGIFTSNNNQLYRRVVVPNSGTEIISKQSFNPCISPTPVVCYRIDSYVTTQELPVNPGGYALTVQRCCRIAGINNVIGSSQIGVSYTNTIPGSINGVSYTDNNSAIFAPKDTAVVCYNGSFTFDFGATDIDKDSLVYSFCDGLVGGSAGGMGAKPDPPSNPPYSAVPYSNGYSGSSPMGPTVSINSKTGLISGIAPSQTGDYVVAVCALEYRNGVMIGSTKKEIHITVANCSLSAAELKPSYITCDDFSMTFRNESTSPLVSIYTWDFGDPRSGTNNISNAPQPTHTYSDTGIYPMKLRVESSGGCKDSTTSLVRVFPGFVGDFAITGSCFETPFAFTDKTVTKYGVVDSWSWDFGDPASTTDISNKQNDVYKYTNAGTRTATLIVTNSKGCIATVTKPVVVSAFPLLNLSFHDTLICSIDTLPIKAEGTGIFTWTPNVNIINPNSANPLVYPKDTTTYVVTLNENGCIKKDSIKVNVLDLITVELGNDTAICRTDSITMKTVSHALQYSWTPTNSLNNPTAKNPVATPNTTTKYYVTANLGKCPAYDSILVKVDPYPIANAGADISICYGTRTQLNGNIAGATFTWSPASSLSNPNTLTPSAGPTKTTSYILAAFNDPTSACPKPARDTVVVSVIPPVKAFAGNDTNVVANQPLLLNATGGSFYLWTPTAGLNNNTISNPIATLGPDVGSITYRVRVSTEEGCFAEDDITVKVFKTGPDIFVPSAFTPNNDRKNDILKPILVGMSKMTYFRVYNRWGQLIYSTSEVGQGWDGRVSGTDQASGTYVYSAEAIDYKGTPVVKKGTVVLIR